MTDHFIHRFEPGAKPAPAIVALHGTGGDENDLVPLARAIDPDAAILSPRGRVLENGMPRFFRRLAEGVFDLDDLRTQTAALARFIEDAAARHRLVPSGIVALGYSNGANIAASILLSHPHVLAGAVLLRPMVPFEPAHLPELSNKPILISAGRRDPIIQPALAERLAQLLEQSGARVTTLWQPGGHALAPGELEQVADWWKHAVKPG